MVLSLDTDEWGALESFLWIICRSGTVVSMWREKSCYLAAVGLLTSGYVGCVMDDGRVNGYDRDREQAPAALVEGKMSQGTYAP